MITQADLKNLFDYDPATGIFTRKISRGGPWKPGKQAGFIENPHGHIRIRINGKAYLAHRLAWLYIYGEFPQQQIDHINAIPSDNRISNLRLASPCENSRNCRLSRNNTSGFKGVSRRARDGKWLAHIRVNGKSVPLGAFTSKLAASEAYDAAALKHFGQFARTNKQLALVEN